MRRAGGEGALYWDKGRGTWVAQIDAGVNPVNGKRRRIKMAGHRGESKASVAQRVRERMRELESTTGGVDTVADLVKLWMTRAAPKSRSESTMLMTKSLVANHIIPVLGSARLSSLTVEDIEAWLDARADLSKSTLVKLRAILAQAFDLGMKRRHVSWNPARAAELPHDADQTREPRALSSSEAKSLMNAADNHRLGAWITVAMTLGLRPGEVSGLTWDRIDFDAGTVTISQALGWPNPKTPTLKATKTGNSRTLAMPGVTIDALRLHRKRQAEERLLMGDKWPTRWADLVFVSEAGTPLNPSGLRKIIQRLAVEAGIDGTVTPYDCRHSATTLMAAAGMSADRLADMLGHKDTRMVWGHYRHRVGLTVTTAADYWADSGTR